MQKDGSPDNNVAQLTLMELRKEWTKYWRVRPHRYIGRQMLIKSLEFKLGGFN